ncbi:multiple sugar transport system permease protein [Paenibacillus sp. V4I3]|uniref:carbohydrate ABC transporter permease n=1 Tax=Paenibacillus sp. V4I3 TaxID=3042305 RepID=UPI00277F4E8B|nr:carbohydrate ABC transporter permease [Paenibacillus sp. V4I3]MDQ0871522.1 multiple sugar transport system permease protein [Paenibacillus sp. V4I3]
MKNHRNAAARNLLTQLVLIALALNFAAPLLWMISTSLKDNSQLYMDPPRWIPNPMHWRNYFDAFTRISFPRMFSNTLIVTVFSTLGMLIVSPLAAYSLAKLDWRGKGLIFGLTVSVMMIPGPVTMIPEFLLFHKLKWVGTLLPLIVKHALGVPVYIFMLRQFFKGLPSELQQAARIDGAGEFHIYWRIMLPLAMPAVLATGLFQVMSSWNDFLGPLLYLNDPSQYTLSLGLQQFQNEISTEWGLLMAATFLMILPIIILFFFLQKSFIQGITFTGIKG